MSIYVGDQDEKCEEGGIALSLKDVFISYDDECPGEPVTCSLIGLTFRKGYFSSNGRYINIPTATLIRHVLGYFTMEVNWVEGIK